MTLILLHDSHVTDIHFHVEKSFMMSSVLK